MSIRTRVLPALALAVALGSAGVAPAARASHPVEAVVSGKVTDIRSDTIYVAGKPYKILPNSAAARELGKVHPGAAVNLVLNGPAGDAATRVIGIVAQPSP